jgi:hypothetical protein
LRIAGPRIFQKKSAFDNVIVIMPGSVFVGASPFIATSDACLALVVIHWMLARFFFQYKL